jgi:hypothetical protein
MKTFCTIITADYFPRALALFKSLRTYDAGIRLHVLIADDKAVAEKQKHEGLILLNGKDISAYRMVHSLYRKYAHENMDYFRWSLKPVFISYLLEHGYEKVLYVDADMFFVNDYNFLFNELDSAAVLLTPHWKTDDPLIDKESFLTLFTSGIFTAGFIGANQEGLPAMAWWAEACHFMMGPLIQLGIHDDQKYLDLLPVKFESVKIVRHRGCTVGSWNFRECKRELVNGQVRINGQYPVIFIHFDNMLVSEILKGHDPLLLPYLQQYQRTFDEMGFRSSDFLYEIDAHADANLFLRVKWKLKLRTRIKSILSRIAQSL